MHCMNLADIYSKNFETRSIHGSMAITNKRVSVVGNLQNNDLRISIIFCNITNMCLQNTYVPYHIPNNIICLNVDLNLLLNTKLSTVELG